MVHNRQDDEVRPWKDDFAQRGVSQDYGYGDLAFSDGDSIDPNDVLSIGSGGWGSSEEDIGAGTREVDHNTIHGTQLDSVEKQIRLIDILPRREEEHDMIHCRVFKAHLPPDSPDPDARRYNSCLGRSISDCGYHRQWFDGCHKELGKCTATSP